MSILQERRMTIFSSSGTDAGPSNPNVSPPVDPTNISFSAKRLASEESLYTHKGEEKAAEIDEDSSKASHGPSHTLLGSR
ncbi:hypothetical protein MJO29_005805 [Puccinia striiformis f. sp. tritici]|uniref:Uncharacterized protein n=1 Tax=Puccinia striiformis f. sp. tritici PST-78 TaxID=1165861 RepID=A0A0L0UYT9_9BASI|nr:hypothetical protein Pst134EB_011011 [Puccinia striiformis f. sp. tritici]KAI7960737.1 hypothetical protein MJO29_005805 [Puccinia striiformis f. sp. tritici]KAI9612185.1 hypothetical protein H4Q26_008279 [Puccinia striiformis f. sp. tritici PST-130]KNE92190.1 hypothetical protein PSTG_14425 [Puccinia striiformis f. sp. tritici PST-78]